MLIITKWHLDKMTVEILQELISEQFELLDSEEETVAKLNQNKGAITALLMLREKIGANKTWI